MRIAIDGRELTKPKPSALALVLMNAMKASPENEYIVLSDVAVPKDRMPEGCENIEFGRRVPGGLLIVPYQYWMRRTVESLNPDFFYEVDHYLLFRFRTTPTITTIHDIYVLEGLEHFTYRRRLAYKAFIEATLRNSTAVTVVSEFTRSRVLATFQTERSLPVVPIGVESPMPEAQTVRPEQVRGPFLLSLGRVSAWKGSVRLAAIFERYMSGRGYTLVFAGRCDRRDAQEGSDLRAYVERCDDIVWLDYVDCRQKEWLLQNTSLLCYPSMYDGFGLPPIEAALRRTPFLSNDIAVLREVLCGEGEYVNYYGDEGVVARKLEEILDAPPAESELERRYQVASRYSWRGFFDSLRDAMARERCSQ